MNNPRFIYFAGIDGCGKSTVIEELIKEYRRKGIKARSVWLRFNYFFTKPVLFFCRIIGITRRVKKGDKILFSKYGGDEIKIEGHEYKILKEEDVLAIIE